MWVTLSLPAFDWGGSTSFFGYVEKESSYNRLIEGQLGLWLSFPISDSYSLLSQGSFRASDDPLIVADLDLLYVEGLSAFGERAAVGVQAGRLVLSEFSGLVLEHRGDGAVLSLSTRHALARVGAVYTGLLLKPNSTLVMSKLDEIDDRDDEVRLAPRRLLALGEFQFIEPMPRTDVALAVIIQQDLRGSSDLIKEGETELDESRGGLVDTRYALLGISGALGRRSFYDITGGVQSGRVLSYRQDPDSATGSSYAYADTRAFIGSAGFEHYSSGPRAGRLALSSLYSSGDADARSLRGGNRSAENNQFQPVATRPIGLVAAAQPGNLMTAGIEYSLRPFTIEAASSLSELQTSVSGLLLMRALDSGPVDMPGVDVDRGGRYLGTELGASIVYRPFYDLGIALAGGVLLPNNSSSGPIVDDRQDPRFKVQAEVSLSF
ncbi:MAG: hypothetical protein EA384_01995 [Spirochaetaceae bacterium]|nr:MAG: hypothetical protein EA384_01995 [Spirochaetaceae bacterium]